jgi:hypothetical protein
MRIVALAGVLLIALAGGAFFVLHKSKPGTAAVPPTHLTTTPAKTHSLRSSPAHHRSVRVVNPLVNPLLPAKLRAALGRHPVVVAVFYDSQNRTDSLTVGEARAGAAAGGAGFVPVNLLDDKVAGRLTALLPSGELLPSPGILVFKRPGRVVWRFDGYLDRQAVAQAVDNAK